MLAGLACLPGGRSKKGYSHNHFVEAGVDFIPGPPERCELKLLRPLP